MGGKEERVEERKAMRYWVRGVWVRGEEGKVGGGWKSRERERDRGREDGVKGGSEGRYFLPGLAWKQARGG